MLIFFSLHLFFFNISQQQTDNDIKNNNNNKTGNGYIEGIELDGFLREFVSSANPSDAGIGEVSVLMFHLLYHGFS